ncbi:MAG: universal stress protein [Candidatus Melainabacteria bacterium]|nr:universal stress protein [Candidatus Melainabacteria bacterium]
MRNILVAVDDSEFTGVVLQSILDNPWSGSPSFHVVTVIPEYAKPTIMETYNDYGIHHKLEYKELRKAALDMITRFARAVSRKHPESQVSKAVLVGDTASSILDCARERGCDLIVVGSHGKNALARFVMGSVSNKVLQHSACPVEVVRKTNRKERLKVLIPVDFSESARAALDLAAGQLSPDCNIYCKVVTAIEPVTYYYQGLEMSGSTAAALMTEREKSIKRAGKELPEMGKALVERFGRDNVSFEVCDGYPADEIIDIARTWPADIIVMGSHGRQGFSKLILGSVSQSVAMHAPCSVIVIRPSKSED